MDNQIENPMGTNGFEFVEFTAPDTNVLEDLFRSLGFKATARHRSKNVTLYKQGDINFLVNYEPNSFAQAFAKVHGPSACAMAFRVENAAEAYERALSLGAKPFHESVGPMELNIPAIKGIGGSLIYLVDRYGSNNIYDVDFLPIADSSDDVQSFDLGTIDHLTHNVHRGRMDEWSAFYERIFNFREIRYFDIKGQQTGLHSRAMVSPCGKIRIPINESVDDKSQIEEFLEAYKGEGIQHIALTSDDIYKSIEDLRDSGMEFMTVPDTYYEAIEARIPGHNEDVERLAKNKILIDGEYTEKEGKILLQIFTKTVIGPIFFEIIQRKGNQGFGEGNFQALFESIELDQIRRGVLSTTD